MSSLSASLLSQTIDDHIACLDGGMDAHCLLPN
jgi:hypothetical protein